MMSPPPSSQPHRGWPVALLGMLALVSGIEFVVASSSDRYTSVLTEIYAFPRRSIRKAVGCDVIAVGDSLVKHGVLPNVLERRLGLRGYNLALPGLRAPGSYFLFRRALAAGAKPRVLLIDGDTLDQDPKALVRLWPETASLAECAELGLVCRDVTFFSTMVVSSVLPSFKARLEVRKWVMDSLNDLPESFRVHSLLPLYRRNWEKNRGTEAKPPYVEPPDGDHRADDLVRVGYNPPSWVPNPVNLEYTYRLLDLARERDIAVLWLIPPVTSEIQRRREESGWYGGYTAFLRDLAERHPNVTVIEGRHVGYSAKLIGDMMHLDVGGAILFSDATAPVIRDRLASASASSGPRWVTLPPCPRDQQKVLIAELGDDAEDLNESIAAFKKWEQIQRMTSGNMPTDAKILRR